jgi:hypothetical protein
MAADPGRRQNGGVHIQPASWPAPGSALLPPGLSLALCSGGVQDSCAAERAAVLCSRDRGAHNAALAVVRCIRDRGCCFRGHAVDAQRRLRSSAQATAGRSRQRSLDLGTVVVGMPNRDLGQAVDPAVTGLQILSCSAGHQCADGRAAAAQMLHRLGRGHCCSRGSVLGIERVDDI